MAYPLNKIGTAAAVGVDPTLNGGMLTGFTNLARCLTALDQVNGPLANQYTSLMSSGWKAIQGAWAWVVAIGELFNGSLTNVSNGDGDAIEIELEVPSTGTYTLFIGAPLDADAPIVMLYLDEVQIGVVGGYDLYAAAPDIGAAIDVPGLVLAAGNHKLKVLANGLNVASVGYTVRLNAIELIRTA